MNDIPLKVLSYLPVLVPALCMGADTARWLLFSQFFPRLVALAVGLGIGGVALSYLEIVDQPKLLIAFFAPCLQLLFLRFAYSAFKARAGRWPVDVVFNWSRGLAVDRAFVFFTVLPAIAIPVLWMGRY